ncbi:capsule assembly Wzi family protein [Persicobacter sp. CCB-QB2]|uniref:capsule assembly Wzi family protein n=1 Tax=Persicobacter sp. CCB-QB2 TaxID=1561025 RepID=UPI0006A99833|nr:capsule assembly Wzi family protein [Persicobacter sp. CCB-QB2]
MKWFKYFGILILGLLQTGLAIGKSDSLAVYGQSFFATGNSDFLPFWIASNRNGIFDYSEAYGGTALLGGHYDLSLGGKFSVEAGLELLGTLPSGSARVQQGYVNLNMGAITLMGGKQHFTLGMANERLSSGSLIYSNNAAPVPRIGLGIFDYTGVPFVEDWLEVKGGVMHAFLDDDRGERGTDAPQIHEKFAYMRLSKFRFKPYFGLVHSALMNGTNPNGQPMTSNYWAVALRRPDPNGSNADRNNVAGAHSGIVDFGFDFDFDSGATLNFFFQKPLKDKPTLDIFGRNQDFFTGVTYLTNKKTLVSGVNIEVMKTTYQSGAGTPDPVVDGKYVHIPSQIAPDPEKYMYDNFGIVAPGITTSEVIAFLEDEVNYGHEFGGRANYLNNQDYYMGWTYHGRAMGPALFTTVDQVKMFIPDFDDSWDFYFANNRIFSTHFAVEGWLSPKLYYRAKFTNSQNYGSYAGLNQGRFSWESMNPDSDYEYFFEDGLSQNYTLIEFNYDLNPKLNIGAGMAYDFGEMYHNFGAILSLKYSVGLR